MSFKEFKLKEVCKVRKGIGFKNSHFKDFGFPVLKNRNIKNGIVEVSNLSYCDRGSHPKGVVVENGDVLITSSNVAGKVGINLHEQNFFMDCNLFKLEPNKDLLDKRYLYYYLLNSSREIEKHITQSNAPTLQKAPLENLTLKIPDMSTQIKIANVLNQFTELQRELSLRRKQHNYYRNAIFESLTSQI